MWEVLMRLGLDGGDSQGTELVGLALLSPSLIIQLLVWGQTPTTDFSPHDSKCVKIMLTHYRCVSTVQHIFTLELLSSTLCGFAYPACILHRGYWLSLTYPVIQLCLKSTKYNRYKIILNGCVGNQLWSAFYCRFGVVVEP